MESNKGRGHYPAYEWKWQQCDSAGMKEQFPLDKYGLSSPSDSSIDGKPIGNWPDYSLPSIYSCATSIKCYQHG